MVGGDDGAGEESRKRETGNEIDGGREGSVPIILSRE